MLKEALWEDFYRSTKDNITIILSFNDDQLILNKWFNKFPNLSNKCYINYISSWSEESLIYIVNEKLKQCNLFEIV